MKVKELQDLIKDLDPEAEIFSWGHKFKKLDLGYAQKWHDDSFITFRSLETFNTEDIKQHEASGWIKTYYF